MLHLVPIVRSLNRLKVIKETSTSPAPSMLSTSIAFMTEQSPRQVAINLNNIDDSRCIEDKLLKFLLVKPLVANQIYASTPRRNKTKAYNLALTKNSKQNNEATFQVTVSANLTEQN
jgi:hypothetical protein